MFAKLTEYFLNPVRVKIPYLCIQMEIRPSLQTYVAKTVSGLEEVLEQELIALGASGNKRLTRAVEFKGDKRLLYKINYCCFTALRILVPVNEFVITQQEDLYSHVSTMPWEEWLDPAGTFAIDAVISNSVFTNSLFVAQRTKDAIADRIRGIRGTRPSVDLENPSLRISVHIRSSACTISLDSSGNTLHKRGYRKRAGDAPVSEVLAAGLIRLAGWDPSVPLYDPMCGSGTIPIEAALMATHTPAGKFRTDFGFTKWKDFDPELWDKVRAEADALIIPSDAQIRGADSSLRAIDGAKMNLRYSNTEALITLQKSGFHDTKPPYTEGMIIMNPPYDERLILDDSMAFYRSIGDTLKHLYGGYRAWIISGDLEAMKFIGLKPAKKFKIFNGPLECRFMGYDLFRGTMKDHKTPVNN
jgi:putative N6-adenine-specific DNA methylase